MDGGGFEPPKQYAADLQSVPFGHSGIHPFHCHFKICPDNEILYHMNFSDARYNFYFFKFFLSFTPEVLHRMSLSDAVPPPKIPSG